MVQGSKYGKYKDSELLRSGPVKELIRRRYFILSKDDIFVMRPFEEPLHMQRVEKYEEE